MRKVLTLAILFLMMSSAHALLLVGAECDEPVYAHELFNCSAILLSTSGSVDVTIYPHSADGLFESLVPEVSTTVSGARLTRVELNLWARDAGTDALVLDILGDEKVALLVPVRITNPPLVVDVDSVRAEAGRREELRVKLYGSGLGVRVWLESPTSSIEVSDPVDLGDVRDEETAELYLTPAPHAFGRYTVYLYVFFVDENGPHVLRYEVRVDVAPPVYLIGIALGLLAAVGLAAYILFRRRKPSNEAQ